MGADRTSGCILRALPIETIVGAVAADEFRGVMLRNCPIFLLGIHQCAANSERLRLVVANAPVADFLPAQLSIEIPSAVVSDQGNRQWPVLRSDVQRNRIIRFQDQAVHLVRIFARTLPSAPGVPWDRRS